MQQQVENASNYGACDEYCDTALRTNKQCRMGLPLQAQKNTHKHTQTHRPTQRYKHATPSQVFAALSISPPPRVRARQVAVNQGGVKSQFWDIRLGRAFGIAYHRVMVIVSLAALLSPVLHSVERLKLMLCVRTGSQPPRNVDAAEHAGVQSNAPERGAPLHSKCQQWHSYRWHCRRRALRERKRFQKKTFLTPLWFAPPWSARSRSVPDH